MKSELGQSVDHFKRAASLAAQETSATVGPKFTAARDRVQPTATKAKDAASSGWDSALATLAPLITAATENARQVSDRTAKTAEATKKSAKANKKNAKKLQKRTNKALGRKQKSSKSTKLGGLLLAGAAVGAAGAYVMNKRRRDQWDEYDPTPATPATRTGADDAAFEPAGRSGVVTPIDETAPVVGAVSSDPAPGTKGIDPTVGAGKPEPTIELVDADAVDQTSSAQHSPKVARMAGGQNKS
jgi:hypothetical protein